MKISGRITSTGNPRIKGIINLEKKREREKQGLFLIEGQKECRLALRSGYTASELYYCPEIFPTIQIEKFIHETHYAGMVYEVTPEVYARIAYRESTEGICVVASTRSLALENLLLPENPLLIVIEAIEKPGNIGAILRTADAAGAHGVIVCDPLTDLYNPNVVRASRGCLFSVPTAVAKNSEALNFLHKNKIRTFAAALPAEKVHYQARFTLPSAIILGTESEGLSDFWLKNTDELIKIPMKGEADSLNVSTSAAILIYEALRQREFSQIVS